MLLGPILALILNPMGKFIMLATLVFLAGPAKGQNLGYIVNTGASSVSVMSTVDETIVQTIQVGNFPVHLAVSPDGARGYVTLGNESRLAVIDLATNVIVDSIPLSLGVMKLAITPDGTRAWITNAFGSVAVVNLSTKVTESVIPVGAADIVFTPDGSRAYVLNQGISVIDTASRAVIATLAMSPAPSGMAISRDGQKLYVGNGPISIFSTATNTRTNTIFINRQAASLVAMNPLGTRAYFQISNGLAILDTASETVIGTVTTGINVTAMAFTPDGKRILMLNRFQGTVSVFDTATNTIVGTAVAGADPASITVPWPASGLSTHSISFYPQAIGTTTTTTVTFTNPTNSAVSISGTTLSGADFSQTNNCGISLPAGSTCSIDVSFTPAAQGPSAGSIVVTSSVAGSPHIIRLTASGIAPGPPAMSLTPASMSYAVQTVGTTSAPQYAKITNTGSEPLVITNISTVGNFSQLNNCVRALPATASCSIIVNFSPQTAGPHTGSITIADNAAGAPHTISVTGLAASPQFSVSPGSLEFPPQVPGTTSLPKFLTLTNTGVVPVIFFQPIPPFSFLIASNTCFSLAPGQSCQIGVTFQPHSTSLVNGNLPIQSTAPDSPKLVSLSGNVPPPEPVITLSTNFLAFALQAVGSASQPQSITLTNTGTATLFLPPSAISVTGPFTQTNDCLRPIVPGATCAFSVNYAPLLFGPGSGRLELLGFPGRVVSLAGWAIQSFEAEAPANTLEGNADIQPCAECSGGRLVRRLGSDPQAAVTFPKISPTQLGSYTLTIFFVNHNGLPRTLNVTVNGGQTQEVILPTTERGVPEAVTLTVFDLPVGDNALKFSQPVGAGPAPGLDRITLQ